MKAHTASLYNALALIGFSLWGYFSSTNWTFWPLELKTSLIPFFVGIVLLALNTGVKTQNKVVAHIAVLLTLVILFGLIKPLMGAFGRSDSMAIARVAIMLVSTVIALVAFIKNFKEARKNKAA